MNLKQYLETNYLKIKCHMDEMNDGYGFKLNFKTKSKQNYWIAEVHDDFIVVVEHENILGNTKTIIPFSCLTIIDSRNEHI